MRKPVISRKITATFCGDEIFVEASDESTVSVYLDPAVVIAVIRKGDRRRSRKSDCTIVTTIEWCNVPAGFKPPK